VWYRAALIILTLHTSGGTAIAQPLCDLSAGSNWQPNEGPTDYSLHLQPIGELKALMVFVDFPDAAQSESTASLYNLLVPNSLSWYTEVSYDRMSLNVTPVHTWFRMPKNSGAYGFGDGLTFEEHRAYIADAIAASDAAVDYSPYQIVYVVAAKNSAITYSPAFHAYPGDGVDVDGIEIRHSATFGEDIRNVRPNYGSYVLIHETGHLIGLPDLYEWGAPLYEALRFAGGWDTMSFVTPGAHFMAWHKRKHGWLDPEQIVCHSNTGSVEATVTPVAVEGGVKAIVVPYSNSKAYVVEVRQPIGEDARLCDKGVLIYTVDAKVANGAGPVIVKAAHNGSDPDQIDACGPLYDAPFDLGPGEIASYNDPAAGVSMQIISAAGDNYVIRVTRTATAPDLIVSAVSNPPAVALLKQKFAITDSTHNQGSASSAATTNRYYLSLDTIKGTGDKRLSGKRAVAGLAAGATSTGTATVTVPAKAKLGVYYVLGCADDLKAQTESNELNNCRATNSTVDVRAPDLIETAITNPPASIARGSSFSVTDTTANQGNASSPLTTTRYYLSLDTAKSTNDRLLTGSRNIPILAPAATSAGTVTVTVPGATTPASYFLLACADDLKKTTESNETNNCKPSGTKVVVN
jgi:M6 family metalloprotease-like protein